MLLSNLMLESKLVTYYRHGIYCQKKNKTNFAFAILKSPRSLGSVYVYTIRKYITTTVVGHTEVWEFPTPKLKLIPPTHQA